MHRKGREERSGLAAKYTGLPFTEALFVSGFALPARDLLHHLSQPAGPRFRFAIVKDAEQMCTLMRWRDAIPFRTVLGVPAKSQLHDWRKRKFGLHSFHEKLGHLL